MIPIINILLIVGILIFILYNLYVDTRNWSNTGSFLEGMENSAGSASKAEEDQIKQRAGDVAPMSSNVPQNCKKGCVKPTGPSGNCKVIQKDGPLVAELKKQILTKATIYKKENKDKNFKPYAGKTGN